MEARSKDKGPERIIRSIIIPKLEFDLKIASEERFEKEFARELIRIRRTIDEQKDRIVVVKLGGETVSEGLAMVLRDIGLLRQLQIRTVLVHGGGREITRELGAENIDFNFVNGVRVTKNPKAIGIIKRVMRECGARVVRELKAARFRAGQVLGWNGVLEVGPSESLDHIGEVQRVNIEPIVSLVDRGSIPVITPLGFQGRRTFNINADPASSEIAIALNAARLVFVTNVNGVRVRLKTRRSAKQEYSLPTLYPDAAERLIKSGKINGGMIPKVRAAISTVERSDTRVSIINGRKEHALLFGVLDYVCGSEVSGTSLLPR